MVSLEELDASPVRAADSEVRRGPVEGMLLVNGRPQMERSDMPVITIDSILALQRFTHK